ncbi:hypothetical protein NL676_010401 [Syzygium grande]|nr:hypothetical protein NL676_010401 [Syzygium grande]
MLVGAYPFEDPHDPRNFRKTIDRILTVQYSIPDYVRVSVDCRQLLSRIFVANPAERITLPKIKQHPWFLKNSPKELIEVAFSKEDISTYTIDAVDDPRTLNKILYVKPPANVYSFDDQYLDQFVRLSKLQLEVSPSQCQDAIRQGIGACMAIAMGQPPSATCCSRIRVTHTECMCPLITPEVAVMIDVDRAKKLVKGCRRKILPIQVWK